ncbi:MAG: hypothetical protein WA323_27285 [Candidatus Nitrosopolaris sp.]
MDINGVNAVNINTAQVSNSTATNSTSVQSIRVIALRDNTTLGIAYDPIHRTMYLTSWDSNTVSVINTDTRSEARGEYSSVHW